MPLLPLILLAAACGGIASAAFAIVLLWVREEHSTRLLPHLVSFATGALLGASLLALLPEAIEGAGAAGAHRLGLTLLVGLGAFFVLEKLVLWWHARAGDERREDVDGPPGGDAPAAHHAHRHGGAGEAHPDARDRAAGTLVLVGDSLHNALDGVLIAAAFLSSTSLGLVTTVAVAAHEVPHRVGDFAILVHAGLSRPRALLLNLATGIAAVLGALIAYFGLREALGALPYALAFAAAGFLYIAVAGLIPGLHRRTDARTSAVQVLLIVLGVAVIAAAERLAGT